MSITTLFGFKNLDEIAEIVFDNLSDRAVFDVIMVDSSCKKLAVSIKLGDFKFCAVGDRVKKLANSHLMTMGESTFKEVLIDLIDTSNYYKVYVDNYKFIDRIPSSSPRLTRELCELFGKMPLGVSIKCKINGHDKCFYVSRKELSAFLGKMFMKNEINLGEITSTMTSALTFVILGDFASLGSLEFDDSDLAKWVSKIKTM